MSEYKLSINSDGRDGYLERFSFLLDMANRHACVQRTPPLEFKLELGAPSPPIIIILLFFYTYVDLWFFRKPRLGIYAFIIKKTSRLNFICPNNPGFQSKIVSDFLLLRHGLVYTIISVKRGQFY
jgi:hypothetical protein